MLAVRSRQQITGVELAGPKIAKATSQPRYAYKLRDFLAPGPRPRLHRYRLNKQVIIFARVTEDLETHTRSPERLM